LRLVSQQRLKNENLIGNQSDYLLAA